jgi:hypothetical protein
VSADLRYSVGGARNDENAYAARSAVMEKGERSKRIKIIPQRKAGLDAKPEIGK